MTPKLGLVVSYAPLEVGHEKAPEILRQASSLFSELPLTVVPVEEPVHDLATGRKAAELFHQSGVDAICWIWACWSFDHIILDMLAKVNVPIVAWGLPGIETGSICGAQALMCVLRDIDHPGCHVFGNLESKALQQKMVHYVQAVGAANSLRCARLGMLGQRTIGMTEVAFHEYDVREVFGPVILYQGADQLLAERAAADPVEAERLWGNIKARAGKCTAGDADGIRSMQCYLALKRWVRKEALAGIAMGCYPDLMGEVCLACGMLGEEGIVTSCEGDVNSLLLSYCMCGIGSAPLHNTDMLDFDEMTRAGIFSHCGNSAISLAGNRDDVTIAPVRLMNQGAVALYPGKPGPVTFANLCGKKGTYRMTFGLGEAIRTGMDFPGIPVKVRIPMEAQDFWTATSDFGSGHHWMIAYGDMTAQLDVLCRHLKLDKLVIA